MSAKQVRLGINEFVTYAHDHADQDAALMLAAPSEKTIELLGLDEIKPRLADTRRARASHVLGVAESISALGLLQPPAVDRAHRLIAGLHRLEACRILFAKPEDRAVLFSKLDGASVKDGDYAERIAALPSIGDLPVPLSGGRIPVAVLVGLDAGADPAGAMAAEVAENVTRRKYTPTEVSGLIEKLKKAGYRARMGRPKAGEKTIRPALGLILGLSERQTTRLLAAEKSRPYGSLSEETQESPIRKMVTLTKEADVSFQKMAHWATSHGITPTESMLISAALLVADLNESLLEAVKASARADGRRRKP